MDTDDFLTHIVTIQGEMQVITCDLLKMLALEHKHAPIHHADPNIGLANILATTFKSVSPTKVLNSLNYPMNYDLVYDKTTSPPKVKSSIEIDCFDSTFVNETLKSVEGFLMCNMMSSNLKKAGCCVNHSHHEKCCLSCDHLCSNCGQKNCKKGCPGKKEDHQCKDKHCREIKSVCKKKGKVVCAGCNLCTYCILKLPLASQCKIFNVVLGIDSAQSLRNLFSHLTKPVCRKFLDGKCGLMGFQCVNWEQLSKELFIAGEHLINFMADKASFNYQKCISAEVQKDKIARLTTILHNKANYLKTHFADAIKKCLDDIKDEKISKEMKILLQEITELKQGQTEIKAGQTEIKSALLDAQIETKAGQTKLKAGQEEIIAGFKELIVNFKLGCLGNVNNEDSAISEYQQASEVLKNMYLKKYKKLHQNEAIRSDMRSKFVSHDDIICNLSLTNNQSSDGQNLVTLGNLIDKSDDYVVINGVPGIGKTTLIKTLAYKWASGSILNGKDESAHYDFVFVLFCKNLNKYKDENVTFSDFIENEYVEFFDIFKMINLRKNKEKVLLIIEGFDEFSSYEEFKEITDDRKRKLSPHCQAMYDLLDPENSSLPFDRLVTSRPLSHTEILKQFRTVEIKSLEVIGFTDKEINNYVDKHFAGDKKKSEAVKRQITENPHLSQLASRPVFCWAFCSLFKERVEGQEYIIPTTLTAIYGSIILIFLRHHGTKKTNMSLDQLITEPEIKKTICQLAEIAYISLKQGKLLFKVGDIGKTSVFLQSVIGKSGLIETLEGGDFNSNSFQFTHLSIHEFLANLHIFLNELHIKDAVESHAFVFSLPSSLLFLAGFIGGNMRDSVSHKFTKVYAKLGQRKECTIDEIKSIFFMFTYDRKLMSGLYYEMLFEFQNSMDSLPKVETLFLPGDNNLLSSYSYLCVEHLFKYIERDNNGILPCRFLFISQRKLQPAIIKIILPYMQKAHLILSECNPGFIKEIASLIPFIENVSLPHCNVDDDDWNALSRNILQAHTKKKLKLKFFEVKDLGSYIFRETFDYEHPFYVPDRVYRFISKIQEVHLDFATKHLNILASDKFFTPKLQVLHLTLRDKKDFYQLADQITQLPDELKILEVRLFDRCMHQNYSRFSATQELVQTEDNSLTIKLTLKTDICKTCSAEVIQIINTVCSKKFLLKHQNVAVVQDYNMTPKFCFWDFQFEKI